MYKFSTLFIALVTSVFVSGFALGDVLETVEETPPRVSVITPPIGPSLHPSLKEYAEGETPPTEMSEAIIYNDVFSVELPLDNTVGIEPSIDGIVTVETQYEVIEFDTYSFDSLATLSCNDEGEECLAISLMNDADGWVDVTVFATKSTGCIAHAGCDVEAVMCTATGPNATCSCEGNTATCSDGEYVTTCTKNKSNSGSCTTKKIVKPQKRRSISRLDEHQMPIISQELIPYSEP